MQQAVALETGVHSRRTAYLLLGSLVLLWGANWPVMKLTLAVLPPFWFVTIRLFLGSGSLFIALALAGGVRLPGRGDLLQLTIGGLVQLALYMTLCILGLQSMAAGRAAVLAYTTPLWVVPGALLFLGERLNSLKAAGLALGIVGVLVLFNPLGFDWHNGAEVRGNLLLMGAAFAWAAAILVIRGHSWRLTPFQLAPWQMLLGGCVLLMLSLAVEGPLHARVDAPFLALLLYNGPICIGFCGWAALVVTRSLPAVTSSLSFLAVPAFGIAAAEIALGEPLDPTLLGGFALILGGMILVGLGDRRQRAQGR
ncbi:MAG TPA: DMT family transporter [Dongiaceae bacterium]|nr:DMT family transporter [Dongiaceae bacterium]